MNNKPITYTQHTYSSSIKSVLRYILACFTSLIAMPLIAKRFTRFDQHIAQEQASYARKRLQHFARSDIGKHYGLDKKIASLYFRGRLEGVMYEEKIKKMKSAKKISDIQALNLLRECFPIQSSTEFYETR